VVSRSAIDALHAGSNIASDESERTLPMIELVLAAVALGAGGLWLGALSWRRRSVLALVCGLLGIAWAVAAGAEAWAGRDATDAIAGSLAALSIGTVLMVLGRAMQRLLDG
jgi:hypothetical protein